MRGLIQDLRQAWRKWLREPRTFLLVVTALALGIGTNTAVFSLVQAVLFRSLPVERADQLVRVCNTETRGGLDMWNTSLPIYQDYRDQSTAFSGLAAYRDQVPVHLSGEGASPERITAAVATGNYFQVLGVRPFRGRLLLPEDDAGAAPPVVAVSHALWQRRFGGDPGIVGRTVILNRTGFTVVGVAPPGFSGIDPGRGEELWVPLAWAATADPMLQTQLAYRSSSFFHVVGRLRPGASPQTALTQLETVSLRQRASGTVSEEDEGFEEPWPRVVPITATVHPEATRLSWLLLGSVLLVLLAACADVAGYLLTRSERDQRQVAVLLALGATRSRVVRQPLAEGLLFAGLGAVGGLLLGGWAVRLLVRMAPPYLPIPFNPDLDVLDIRVLAFTAAVSLAVGILVALAPAWRAMSTSLYLVLKSDTAMVGLGAARVPLRNLLVVMQVAASVVLLSGAGLLLRTLFNIAALDPGFKPAGVLVASVDVARQGYEKAAGQSVLERLHQSAGQIPGVSSVALSTISPLPRAKSVALLPPGADAGQEVWVGQTLVSPGYFQTMGIELRRGRDFTPRDRAGAPRTAIVSRTMADRFWPGLDPVGRSLPGIGPEEVPVEIVGVAEDVRNRGFREAPAPVLYLSFAQFYQSYPWQPGATTVLLRTVGEAEAIAPALLAAAAQVDPHLPLYRVEPLKAYLADSFALERFLTTLFLCQSALALVLVGTGLHALLSFTTARRTREFALRITLGARAADLRRLVYAQSLRLIAIGLIVGMVLAVLLSRSLAGLLFGVTATDAPTLVLVAVLLAAIGALAPLGPLRRALAANPAESLRSE